MLSMYKPNVFINYDLMAWRRQQGSARYAQKCRNTTQHKTNNGKEKGYCTISVRRKLILLSNLHQETTSYWRSSGEVAWCIPYKMSIVIFLNTHPKLSIHMISKLAIKFTLLKWLKIGFVGSQKNKKTGKKISLRFCYICTLYVICCSF